jgi:hypothetical protein
MIKVVFPLALALAAGTSFACPGAGMTKDAKVDYSPSVTAALSTKTVKGVPQADKKAVVKPEEAKKPNS